MPPRPRREKRTGQYSLDGERGTRRLRPSRRAKSGNAVVRATGVVAALLVVGLAACGADTQGPVVVRVGVAAIGKTTVDHWTRVIQRGGTFEELRGEQHGMPRQRALALLISSDWLMGEAERQGLRASDHAVEQALVERRDANGGSEFEEGLRATGQSVADVKREIGAELAAKAISRGLARRAAEITQPEIVDFYRRNRHLFLVPEERDAELIENLPSPSAATALVNRIGTGPRFSKMALHEALQRNAGGASSTPDIEGVTGAIFTAPRGVVSRPMRLNHAWTVFVVRKIVPATLKPLAKVRSEVVQRLTARRRRQLAAEFNKQYKARWTARTSCRLGYVVQKCAQYAGPLVAEEDLFSSS